MKRFGPLVAVLLVLGCEKTSDLPYYQRHVTALVGHYRPAFEALARREAAVVNSSLSIARNTPGLAEPNQLDLRIRKQFDDANALLGPGPGQAPIEKEAEALARANDVAGLASFAAQKGRQLDALSATIEEEVTSLESWVMNAERRNALELDHEDPGTSQGHSP